MSLDRLQSGDQVYHPRFGFGVINGLSCNEMAPSSPNESTATMAEFYEVNLRQGGHLLVPVERAEQLGLRRLTNSLSVIADGLRSTAQSLPLAGHARAAELRSRAQASEAQALTYAVRDLLADASRRALTASEKTWLDKAFERLITEAALVDQMSVPEARSAFKEIVEALAGR